MPQSIREKYVFLETFSAAAVIKGSASSEWDEILGVLDEFTLKTSHWLKAGGNRGDIAKQIDGLFHDHGWEETRIDVETRGILRAKGTSAHPGKIIHETTPVLQEGYLVDNHKNKVVVDIEWNAKDGNLDRDMAAYRAWHEAGLIVGAVLITKEREGLLRLAREIWDNYQKLIPDNFKSNKLPIDLTTSTTTSFDKAELRIKRGTAGTCPLLIVGVGEKAWGGEPYPIDKYKILNESHQS